MDRNYKSYELSMLVRNCLEAGKDLLSYFCRENIDAWWLITRCIRVVEKYNITPERYWHGNYEEFTELLTLLDAGYPNPNALLELAQNKTNGEIRNISNHFYQRIAVMFDFYKKHHGYVVLRPSAYMQKLYPDSNGMLYVYTIEKWTHNEGSGIDNPVLVFREEEISSFPEMLKKQLKIF
jgi:hypothetical protein